MALSNDGRIISLKHKVLYHVAKKTFEGTLEEERDNLPEEIIPGMIPHYRCCVYKEREVVRQRIRLAEGKAPGAVDNGNIIQVIEPACADCPISSYIVTDNCQNCLGKACLGACRFGAIHPGEKRSRIDANKCRECGMCAKACPYNAIAHLVRPCKNSCPVGALTYNEDGLSVIDEEKCIRCGQCIHACPFGAISTKTAIVPVIKALKSDTPVYLMIAPAVEGQYGKDITMASWRKAAKEVGFEDYIEVGLGGDLTTAAEAPEWYEAFKNGEKRTTSCCPAFVNMILRHYPENKDCISTALSPMCELSRMIKAEHPGCITVFAGPCTAKKSEVVDQKIPGNADYVLTFAELHAIMKAAGVELEPVEENYQQASIYGKRYADVGVAQSCVEYMKEQGYEDVDQMKIKSVSGGKACKTTLMMMGKGRLKEDFIEGMACEGGCSHGPHAHDDTNKAMKVRDKMIEGADQRTITENLKRYDLTKFNMHREGPLPDPKAAE